MIPSPDGRKSIVVKPPRSNEFEFTHDVSVRVNGHEFETAIGSWVGAEVLWSPDSEAFFVTYSDGGAVGTFHLMVFYVGETGLRIVEPIPNGREVFAPHCFSPENPNVAGIRWVGDSSRLLLAIEVPPHSSCADMGTFRAFEIRLPDGGIVNRFDQLPAKKQFRQYMGAELRNADDSCFKKPGSCDPFGLNSKKINPFPTKYK